MRTKRSGSNETDHWLSLFPRIPSRSTFVRQAANLWQYKQRLQQRLASQLGAFEDGVQRN